MGFNSGFKGLKLSSWMPWLLKMGPEVCPEMSVRNYHYKLRDIPEQRRSHIHRDGSVKPRIAVISSNLVRFFSVQANTLSNVAQYPAGYKAGMAP